MMFSAKHINLILIFVLLQLYTRNCISSIEILKSKKGEVGEWYCGILSNSAYRYNSGNIECWSDYGRECNTEICKTPEKLKTHQSYSYRCEDEDYKDINNGCFKALKLIVPIDEQRDWKCDIYGFGAFRMRDGNAECWTMDGKTCDWDICLPQNKYKLVQGKPTPLSCGLNHLKIFDGFGYTTKNHWCEVSFNALSKNKKGEWYCGILSNAAYRYNTGNIECWSTNGTECDMEICKTPSKLKTDEVKSLSCKDENYKDANHWCSKAIKHLVPKDDNKDWTCGIYGSAAFRVRDGNTECWSMDGKGCDWSICETENKYKLVSETPKPLSCGLKHFELFGAIGYTIAKKNHWCNVVIKTTTYA